jgi:hypothetical protein
MGLAHRSSFAAPSNHSEHWCAAGISRCNAKIAAPDAQPLGSRPDARQFRSTNRELRAESGASEAQSIVFEVISNRGKASAENL